MTDIETHPASAAPGDPGAVPSVAIVNDYEVVVRGLATMLSDYPGRVRVVETKAGEPLTCPVDVALYDTYSQSLGRDGVGKVVGSDEVAKVIVYTWNLAPDLVQGAMEAGVDGYVSKEAGAAELVDAIERVHRGERVVPDTRDQAEAQAAIEADADVAVTEQPVGDWPGRAAGLTSRESEIVAMITQGYTNDEIARRMYLSINTIKSYIRSAYRRMGVTRRSEAVRWGVRNGFSLDKTPDTSDE